MKPSALPQRSNLCALAGVILPLASLSLASAAVRMPEIFSDHMVLQKSPAVPIWGWAEPGEKIQVKLAAATVETVAGSDGRWKGLMNLESIGSGPFELRIIGANEIVLKDVLIGEVWLASGQSNMEFLLKATLRAQEIMAAPPNSRIRQFLVAKRDEDRPVDDIRGKWSVAGPSTLGGFTAVGYHFAKALHDELDVPVALIHASWGASSSEAWTSASALDSDPELQAGRKAIEATRTSYPERKARFVEEFKAWLKATGRSDQRPMSAGEVLASPPDTWEKVVLPMPSPGTFKPGAIWLRRSVSVPEKAAGKPLLLDLGQVRGFEEIYWNGARVLEVTPETHPGAGARAIHHIPAHAVAAGPSDLAIRIFSPKERPGFQVNESIFLLGDSRLGGEWLVRQEFELAGDLPAGIAPQPLGQPPMTQTVASRLFNGMIAPLAPYALAGVIWYQGESNARRAAQYRKAFPLLIGDWRALWHRDDLPFFWCQISSFGNYRPLDKQPTESTWAELREAQSAALSLAATGQAVTIDVGEAEDIHPREKEIPGRRLAAIARAKIYGCAEIPFSGPVYESMTIQADRIVVKFSHTEGGLVAKPLPATIPLTTIPARDVPLVRHSPKSPLEGFAICGPDKKWRWANASIEDGKVVVSSPEVSQPVAVRYAWSDYPLANLVNGAGFPAAPFRTDNFRLTTDEGRYP